MMKKDEPAGMEMFAYCIVPHDPVKIAQCGFSISRILYCTGIFKVKAVFWSAKIEIDVEKVHRNKICFFTGNQYNDSRT